MKIECQFFFTLSHSSFFMLLCHLINKYIEKSFKLIELESHYPFTVQLQQFYNYFQLQHNIILYATPLPHINKTHTDFYNIIDRGFIKIINHKHYRLVNLKVREHVDGTKNKEKKTINNIILHTMRKMETIFILDDI